MRPSELTQFIGTVIFRLCGDANLAATWARQRLRKGWRNGCLVPAAVLPLDIAAWERQHGTHPEVVAALSNLNHKWRIAADMWLVESLVAEDIEKQNSKGIAVAPTEALLSYMRKWAHRPASTITQAILTNLRNSTDKQALWRRCFRRRWTLEWGRLHHHRGLSTADICKRSTLFIRWSRWLMERVLRNKNAVVVNIDETGMADVKDGKLGMVVARRLQSSLNNTASASRRSRPRCTLLAAMAASETVQCHLPQFFLPKKRGEARPTKAVQQVFAETDGPIEAWHGSSGFVTTDVMLHYFTTLRRSVTRAVPGAVVVVVLDAAPVHLNRRVIRHARRLGLHLLIVPGRMTWMLQPLDTHVFAVLKRHVRASILRERMTSPNGSASVAAAMRCCTQGVAEVLQRGKWSRVMRRAGLSQHAEPLRASLSALLSSETLDPNPPTVADLRMMIGCSMKKAEYLWRFLVRPHDNGVTGTQETLVDTATDAHEMELAATTLLEPLMRPASRSTASGQPPPAHSRPGGVGGALLPRGRMLIPVPRNQLLRHADTYTASVAKRTRSHKPVLTPGLLASESQERTKAHKRLK